MPASAGTLDTRTPLFVGMLVGVILILVGLTYFPALRWARSQKDCTDMAVTTTPEAPRAEQDRGPAAPQPRRVSGGLLDAKTLWKLPLRTRSRSWTRGSRVREPGHVRRSRSAPR